MAGVPVIVLEYVGTRKGCCSDITMNSGGNTGYNSSLVGRVFLLIGGIG